LSNKPGGRDCFNLSAFSESNTHRVYRYLEQRTLNFTTSLLLLIFTERASFLLAVRRKSLISWICFGCTKHQTPHVSINYQNTLENHRDNNRTMIVKPTTLWKNIKTKQKNNNKALYNYFSHLHGSHCSLIQLKTQASAICIISHGDGIRIKHFIN